MMITKYQTQKKINYIFFFIEIQMIFFLFKTRDKMTTEPNDNFVQSTLRINFNIHIEAAKCKKTKR